MQHIFLSFIMFLTLFSGQAQLADKPTHIKTADLIKKEFNAKNYKGIYALLDTNIQNKISEADYVKYVNDVSNTYCASVEKVTYTGIKRGNHEFEFYCKSGPIDIVLGVNKKGKITNLQWITPKMGMAENTVIKTEEASTELLTPSIIDSKIDSIVNNFMLNPVNCGLSIAVYQNKKITYYNYGSMARGTNQKPTNKTIYEIGSISKTFTGILFAQAILDKKLALNDPVKKHLGEGYTNLAFKGTDIELVHLANHTSRVHRVPFNLMAQPGFNMGNPYKNYTKEMVMEYLKMMKPDTLPGTKNEYSNLGMALLGIIEEKVYNKTYEELIAQYICQPLSMKDTKIIIPSADTSRFAKGYDGEGNLTPYWDLGALAGAGGIRSTTEDMMIYTKANLEETLPAFKLSHQTTYNDSKNHVALAWHKTITKKGNELIWHNGRTGGFGSFCGFIASKEAAVVVLGNSGNPVDQIAIGILKFLQ